MAPLIKKLVQKSFLRNVVTVASGVAMAQGVSLLFMPVLTRIYGPEIFGIQGVFASVVGLGLTIAALSYPTAIVLPEKDADALGIVRLSLCIGAVVSTLAGILLALWGREFLALLNAGSIADYIFLVPLAMLFGVFSAVLNQWLVRKGQFKILARHTMMSAVVLGSAKTCLGYIHPTATALILTNTFGGFANTLLSYFGWRRANAVRAVSNTSLCPPTPTRKLAQRYADFPLLRTPQNLINTFSQTLPVLLLAGFFGPAAAGQYSIAIAILAAPTALIGNSVASVFYPRITQATRVGENARSLIVRATLGLAGAGVIPFALVASGGPLIFRTIFGSEWSTAGEYAQWLAPWIFFQFINSPAVSAIPALRLQKGLLLYELFSTGAKILSLWIGFNYYKSPYVAVAIFSAVGVVAYVWLITWVILRGNVRVNNRG